jgi:hypothetical protein
MEFTISIVGTVLATFERSRFGLNERVIRSCKLQKCRRIIILQTLWSVDDSPFCRLSKSLLSLWVTVRVTNDQREMNTLSLMAFWANQTPTICCKRAEHDPEEIEVFLEFMTWREMWWDEISNHVLCFLFRGPMFSLHVKGHFSPRPDCSRPTVFFRTKEGSPTDPETSVFRQRK